MKRERLGVNNILPVVSCLSGNVIKTVYENNWMKPRDMSLFWHHTIFFEVGVLAHKGRQIQFHWLEAVMDHICCFHFFPGSCCGNHGCCCTLILGYTQCPVCSFWVNLVWWDVLEYPLEWSWKMFCWCLEGDTEASGRKCVTRTLKTFTHFTVFRPLQRAGILQ